MFILPVSPQVPCTILEVQYEVHHRPADDATAASGEREAAAKAALTAATARRTAIQAQIGRLQQQDELVQGYVTAMLLGKPSRSDCTPPSPLSLEPHSPALDGTRLCLVVTVTRRHLCHPDDVGSTSLLAPVLSPAVRSMRSVLGLQ